MFTIICLDVSFFFLEIKHFPQLPDGFIHALLICHSGVYYTFSLPLNLQVLIYYQIFDLIFFKRNVLINGFVCTVKVCVVQVYVNGEQKIIVENDRGCVPCSIKCVYPDKSRQYWCPVIVCTTNKRVRMMTSCFYGYLEFLWTLDEIITTCNLTEALNQGSVEYRNEINNT